MEAIPKIYIFTGVLIVLLCVVLPWFMSSNKRKAKDGDDAAAAAETPAAPSAPPAVPAKSAATRSGGRPRKAA